MNEYLLFFGLFVPRISLLTAWLTGAIPPNTVPFWFEFFLALFLPRVLIIFYIGATLGWDSPWLILHSVALVVAWSVRFASSMVKASEKKS